MDGDSQRVLRTTTMAYSMHVHCMSLGSWTFQLPHSCVRRFLRLVTLDLNNDLSIACGASACGACGASGAREWVRTED